MNHFYMNSDHAYHSNVITDSVWRATDRIFDRIERGNIVSVCVSSRKIELTLKQRYAVYKAYMDQMQVDVHRRAAENPDDFLLNSYTNVLTAPESIVSHAFLDTMGAPRFSNEPWKNSDIDELCVNWEAELDAVN